MKILTNPIVLHAVVVLFLSGLAFLIGLAFIRKLRQSIEDEAEVSSTGTPSLETLPLHVYNTVIQQLKQQKYELQVQTQTEQRRLRTSENFSQAVLSNLSCGVLVFGNNGLVQQANPAAKQILGFATSTGMGADDLFRGEIAEEVHSVLREGSGRRQLEAGYNTPGGEHRHIAVTVSPVPAVDGSLLGAACLVNDLTALQEIRRQQELRGEISAERALELRTSLTTISGFAQQLATNCDPDLAQQLAADIANEAARLDRSLGGFLTGKNTTGSGTSQAASAGQA
ncbi:MAG TPA: PAS domain-containing protein [Candidatus Sulfotelmatobacter sp.]